MEVLPRGHDTVRALLLKGVEIPNPLSLDIGPEVDPDRIAGRVTIFPGCRIYGAKTVISAGSRLGAEGPVTIDDCCLGPGVELKGGYFSRSVFLRKSNMGLGAQVREGCLLEEEANGAHCVGLKQTILFPFVTLGSLINLCDCLMAGGTSRRDHSEVGSSYIHFNYTPNGDKATASLFGDVPRGVMLNQPPIFLGGQGGAVGPLITGYGTVIAAGSVLRDDVLDDGMLISSAALGARRRPATRRAYPRLARVVSKNLVYLANLVALHEWYASVRRPFFAAEDLGSLVYEGALEVLAAAKRERAKRLAALVATVTPDGPGRRELSERIGEVLALFDGAEVPSGDQFLAAFWRAAGPSPGDYVATVQALPPEVSAAGVQWLQQIVDDLCARAGSLVPSMSLFAPA
ncbi:MAG: UDP-N-acetylglucosamine pyrophosphorylase [Actinobacteria bacterium]|nr:UDP-N-acetylglucosamine pyrophosphorylase [Actinomycetota bacterium]